MTALFRRALANQIRHMALAVIEPVTSPRALARLQPEPIHEQAVAASIPEQRFDHRPASTEGTRAGSRPLEQAPLSPLHTPTF